MSEVIFIICTILVIVCWKDYINKSFTYDKQNNENESKNS